MIVNNILGQSSDSPKKGTKLQFERKTSQEGLILRYCHQALNFEIEELSEIIGLSDDETRKLYYGFRNKIKAGNFDKIYEILNIDKDILLYYANDWKDHYGKISPDLPFPIKMLSNDGTITSERYWFQNAWFEENFKDPNNVSVMRITDNSLSPYGFSRGDVVIASRLPEHVMFRTRNVYMVRERDNGIYARVAELSGAGNDNTVTRLLINPMDKNDNILFSPLPNGVSMIGRLVWKSGLI